MPNDVDKYWGTDTSDTEAQPSAGTKQTPQASSASNTDKYWGASSVTEQQSKEEPKEAKPGLLETANKTYETIPAVKPGLSWDYATNLADRAARGVDRGLLAIPNLASQAYQAATEEPKTEEEKQFVSGVTMGSPRAALAAKRLVWDPSAQAYKHVDELAHQQEQRFAASTVPHIKPPEEAFQKGLASGAPIGAPKATKRAIEEVPYEGREAEYVGKAMSMIPILGPMGLSMGERVGKTGDVAGTVTELGTMTALPEVIAEAAPSGALAETLREPIRMEGEPILTRTLRNAAESEKAFPTVTAAGDLAKRASTATLRAAARNPVKTAAIITAIATPHTAAFLLPEIALGTGIGTGIGGKLLPKIARSAEKIIPDSWKNVGLSEPEVAVEQFKSDLKDASIELEDAQARAKKYETTGQPIPDDIKTQIENAQHKTVALQQGLERADYVNSVRQHVEKHGSTVGSPEPETNNVQAFLSRFVPKGNAPTPEGGPVMAPKPIPEPPKSGPAGAIAPPAPAEEAPIIPERPKPSTAAEMRALQAREGKVVEEPEKALGPLLQEGLQRGTVEAKPVAVALGERPEVAPTQAEAMGIKNTPAEAKPVVEAVREVPKASAEEVSQAHSTVNELGDVEHKKLGNRFGVSAEDYDERTSNEEGRKRTGRTAFHKATTEVLPDRLNDHIVAAEKAWDAEHTDAFEKVDRSPKANAARAKYIVDDAVRSYQDELASKGQSGGAPSETETIANEYLKTLPKKFGEGEVISSRGLGEERGVVGVGGRTIGGNKPSVTENVIPTIKRFTQEQYPGQTARIELPEESKAALPSETEPIAERFLRENKGREVGRVIPEKPSVRGTSESESALAEQAIADFNKSQAGHGIDLGAPRTLPGGQIGHDILKNGTKIGEIRLVINEVQGERIGAIQWVGAEQGAEGDINTALSNKLGLSGVKALKRTLEDVHDLDSIAGFRVGGARPTRSIKVPASRATEELIPTREELIPSKPSVKAGKSFVTKLMDQMDIPEARQSELLSQNTESALRDRLLKAEPEDLKELRGEPAKQSPTEAKGYGESNTVVTKDEMEAAKKSLNDKLSRLSAGVDPTALPDAYKIGMYHVEAGLRSFAEWSSAMVKDLGETIRPHLESIWDSLQTGKPKPRTPERPGILNVEEQSPRVQRLLEESQKQTERIRERAKSAAKKEAEYKAVLGRKASTEYALGSTEEAMRRDFPHLTDSELRVNLKKLINALDSRPGRASLEAEWEGADTILAKYPKEVVDRYKASELNPDNPEDAKLDKELQQNAKTAKAIREHYTQELSKVPAGSSAIRDKEGNLIGHDTGVVKTYFSTPHIKPSKVGDTTTFNGKTFKAVGASGYNPNFPSLRIKWEEVKNAEEVKSASEERPITRKEVQISKADLAREQARQESIAKEDARRTAEEDKRARKREIDLRNKLRRSMKPALPPLPYEE